MGHTLLWQVGQVFGKDKRATTAMTCCKCPQPVYIVKSQMCKRCYMADWRAKNYTPKVRMIETPLERFMSRVDSSGECWIWTGYKNAKGYGKWNKWYAHRFSYVHLIGQIPDGLQIDHLCLNTSCVNPYHLEPVTLFENVRRQMSQPGWHMPGNNNGKTHCINGHEFRKLDNRGKRICQTCKNDWAKKKRHVTYAKKHSDVSP